MCKINLLGISGRIKSGKSTLGLIIQYLIYHNTKPHIGNYYYPTDVFLEELERGDLDLTEQSGWQLKSFAYKLKEICSLMTGIPIEEFDKQEVKSSYLDSKWDRINEAQPCGCDWIMDHGHSDGKCDNCEAPTEITRTPQTVRDLLVEVGSHMRKLNPEVWVDSLFQDYICTHSDRSPNGFDCPTWIITDLRILNEYEAVRARGGKTIRIERPCSSCGLIKGHKMSCVNNKYEHYSETDLDNAEFDYTIINDGSLEDLIRKVEVILKQENII